MLQWFRRPLISPDQAADAPLTAILVDYLVSRISDQQRAESVLVKVSEFQALPAAQQKERLPAVYLLLEKYLTQFDPGQKISQAELHNVLRSEYEPLLALPHFNRAHVKKCVKDIRRLSPPTPR